ncbi:MAG: GH92 family glycosyl hydrolase [Acidimicrobiales bacterium]|nr:GH92 family glycosyl hydrolase [Acidimicrobiales bacterium]
MPSATSDPSALVSPLDGTGSGPVAPGAVGEFPGASLPFGMIQWSPDTVPDAESSGGGYSYADSQINGFSLTHLSGTGCPAYQDVPILPTVGPIGTDPAAATEIFSHGTERPSPGRFAVSLGAAGIETELAVTTRTGLARVRFPASAQSNLLLKVAGGPNPVGASTVHVVGDHEVVGSVTSGQFCQTGTNYTLHFVAVFDRPFVSSGTWDGQTVSPGARACSSRSCGGYVTFDSRRNRDVLMKVGISFVSVADAMANLRAEDPEWSLSHLEDSAARQWDGLLGRITVGGGTWSDERTFYTALYHSLLEPNVVSDVNGAYAGSDGRVHRTRGAAEYANFSEWDTYRSDIQLEALLAPGRVGDMVQSLVDDAHQGGWLPILAIVGGDASQDSGDSADPIIASAYAFGARNFDVRAALAAMVKGATQAESGHGFEIERQYLAEYLTQHFVDAASLDLTSIDYSLGGSVTLEYALDDFSIAQLAQARGQTALAAAMMQRAHNWEYLFDPATGYVQARGSDGSFPAGPAFNPSLFEPGGQLGFEEGNPIQYTWSVPQDLAGLASLMGGDDRAADTLSAFFTQFNAGRYQPYDWAGNEPSLWSPWEFDAFAAPWRTQSAVRDIVNTLYADAPVAEPGNDDLGALSSWYVWAALGLYPITPGTATLALASPLFPETRIHLADGRQIVEHAPGASRNTPFVHTLSVSGADLVPSRSGCGVGASRGTPSETRWSQPWLPATVLSSGATLTFGLARTPDAAWGSDPRAALPSYAKGRLPAVGYTVPSGAVSAAAGSPLTLRLGVQPAEPGDQTVQWHASGVGLSLSPDHGTFVLGRGATDAPACSAAAPAPTTVAVQASTPGSYVLQVQLETGSGATLPPVVVDVNVTG